SDLPVGLDTCRVDRHILRGNGRRRVVDIAPGTVVLGAQAFGILAVCTDTSARNDDRAFVPGQDTIVAGFDLSFVEVRQPKRLDGATCNLQPSGAIGKRAKSAFAAGFNRG